VGFHNGITLFTGFPWVPKSPKILAFIMQDLKSSEIGHKCWKSHEFY